MQDRVSNECDNVNLMLSKNSLDCENEIELRF